MPPLPTRLGLRLRSESLSTSGLREVRLTGPPTIRTDSLRKHPHLMPLRGSCQGQQEGAANSSSPQSGKCEHLYCSQRLYCRPTNSIRSPTSARLVLVRKVIRPKHPFAVNSQCVAEAVHIMELGCYAFLALRKIVEQNPVQRLWDCILASSVEADCPPILLRNVYEVQLAWV